MYIDIHTFNKPVCGIRVELEARHEGEELSGELYLYQNGNRRFLWADDFEDEDAMWRLITRVDEFLQWMPATYPREASNHGAVWYDELYDYINDYVDEGDLFDNR